MEVEGIPDVQKPMVFVAFWHPPGSGLWAHGHIRSGDGHVCPSMISTPPKPMVFHRFLMVSGNAPGRQNPCGALTISPFRDLEL